MKNKIISILVIGLLGYWVIALCGCAGLSRKDTVPRNESLLEPQTMLKFSDIPTPAGFKLLTQDSYTFESAGIRVGMLKYQGKADVEQVVNFYKDQMPLYNWNLLNAIEYGERLLNFEREQETCIIRLLPKGNNITIAIALGPKGGARPKKADKPVPVK
jgi:hypothetical protein